MEVPVINRLSNFDGGVTCLQSTSFLSQILSREKLFQAHSFWTWSALIIAAVASFGTLINRIRVLVVRLQCRYCKSSPSSEPLLASPYDDVSEFSDDDDDDDDDAEEDAISWSSSSSVSDMGDEEPETASFSDDEDFHVKSSSDARRFSWSDFSSSKSVVKLWDSWGLGFDLDSAERVVSEYDAGEYRIPTIATSSTATVMSAETGASGRVRLGVWDARVGFKIPAMLAEWGPQLGRIAGGGLAADGTGKVYVRDDVTDGVTIGDLRNFGLPFKSLTTQHGVDESSSDSAVTRCCEAVRSYLL